MSSLQGVVFATAMAAVSGTAVVLLALKLQKSLPTLLLPLQSPADQFQPATTPASPPRSCISSGEKTGEKKKKKKRVRFAKDVVEPTGNNEEFRKKLQRRTQKNTDAATTITAATSAAVKVVRGRMPANRAALYNGILRDRVVHRFAYSY